MKRVEEYINSKKQKTSEHSLTLASIIARISSAEDRLSLLEQRIEVLEAKEAPGRRL